MKTFCEQYKKAKAGRLRLIYDAVLNRYLVTDKTHWQTWPKHKLLKKF